MHNYLCGVVYRQCVVVVYMTLVVERGTTVVYRQCVVVVYMTLVVSVEQLLCTDSVLHDPCC